MAPPSFQYPKRLQSHFSGVPSPEGLLTSKSAAQLCQQTFSGTVSVLPVLSRYCCSSLGLIAFGCCRSYHLSSVRGPRTTPGTVVLWKESLNSAYSLVSNSGLCSERLEMKAAETKVPVNAWHIARAGTWSKAWRQQCRLPNILCQSSHTAHAQFLSNKL